MTGVLQAKGLSKAFPGVRALREVDLNVERGQVHAVMGENGAGKSTLMNILIGMLQPDSGEILYKGRPVKLHSPHDALKMGVSMIHQELMPFRDLSVAENIFMGREPASRFFGWIDKRAMNDEAVRLLNRLDAPISPTRRMGDLSVAEMQTVEIAKAISQEAEVVIMDEPTSAISEREVERLFDIIADLKNEGVAVIYISHKLEEVFRIADVVTVLRDGQYVATHRIAELDRDTLVALMVGRELKELFPASAAQKGEVALSVRGLTKAGAFHNVDFDVRRGEILGIAGLMGAGRTELVNAIYGLAPADAGEVLVHGMPVRIRAPKDAMANGIAMVTEDRKEYGLVLNMSVKHNVTLSTLRRFCWGLFIDNNAESRAVAECVRDYGIKTRTENAAANTLSGGNQQKVVIAKALLSEPDILILDEPTRGIDIGAKAELHKTIAQLAAEGKAVVMVSSELTEILSLSDRILVMREGSIAIELDAAQTGQEEIMHYAMPN